MSVPTAMERVFVSEEPRVFIEASQKALTALGLPNEILDGAEYRRRFPQFGDVGRRFGVTVHEGKRAVEVAPAAGGCGVRFEVPRRLGVSSGVAASTESGSGLLVTEQ